MTQNIIAIKRSQGNNAPTELSNGELAYSFSSDKLFIGQTNTTNSPVAVEYIGGKLLVDKVANLESIIVTGIGNISFGSLTLTNATNNSVLFAKTDGIVDFITGDSGKILQIAANGTPTFDDLSGGTF